MKNGITTLAKGAATLALLTTGSFITISKVIGSTKFSFSAASLLLPTIAAFFSLPVGGILLAVWHLVKYSLHCGPFTLGIPTMLASASLWFSLNKSEQSTNKIANNLLHLGFPLSCIALFISNPSVGIGGLYATLWLIPVLIHLLHATNRLATPFWYALKSTFIAHATGSIMWLYTVNLASEQWLALIPVALVERLVIAAGQAITLMVIAQLSQQTFVLPRFARIFNRD